MQRLLAQFKWLTVWGAPAICALLAGCAIGKPSDLVRGKGYQPKNVYLGMAALPVNIRRVAVLPLVCDENSFEMSEGRNSLEPMLKSELIKTRKFEVVQSGGEFLKNQTGQTDWSGEEPLPAEFFTVLRENSGCDAVLFSQLTVFRAYPPLAIGWRMRLVDAQTRKTIWTGDEVFDAGQIAVENGARKHQLAEQRNPSGAADEWFIDNSPSKFGEYTVARLFATLPGR